MEFLKNNLRGIVISLLVAGAIIGIASISSDDTSDNSNETESSQTEQTQDEAQKEESAVDSEGQADENDEEGSSDETTAPTVESNDDGFESQTVEGDNQTVVVRRMVESYLREADTELSAEQKLYVETNLVNDLGRTDFVAVGQNIALAESKVAERVEEAKNLSEAAIARWSAYL